MFEVPPDKPAAYDIQPVPRRQSASTGTNRQHQLNALRSIYVYAAGL